MSFKPLNGRVLVKPDPKQTQTASGILIPESETPPQTGTVIVGNETVKAGDRVIFSRYGYDEVKIEGQDYNVVSDSCLLGIIE